MKLEAKRALVIGASSGIGAACARRLVLEGYHVAILGRRKAELEDVARKTAEKFAEGKIRVYPADVTDYARAPALFDQIVTDLGGLDLVIFAAAVMPKLEADEYCFEKDRQMVEVNVLGAIAWLNEAAQFFGRVKQGTIVGISSIAGDRGRRGNPVYGTTKAALNTYLEALRNRLGRHGVNVVTIRPGFVDTQMTKGMDGLLWLITADEAARQIYEAVRCRKSVVYVPRRWRYVGLIIRMIPSWLFKKLDI